MVWQKTLKVTSRDLDFTVIGEKPFTTPRLGGVGVMAVAMLLANTVALAEAEALGA